MDDRSRIIPFLEAVSEKPNRFITVRYNAIARRGIPRRLLLDNHAGFTRHDLRLLSRAALIDAVNDSWDVEALRTLVAEDFVSVTQNPKRSRHRRIH